MQTHHQPCSKMQFHPVSRFRTIHNSVDTATTTTLHPFNGLFSRTTWVSRYQKGIASLDLNEARDDRLLGCSGIRWTICKQSAPRSRQITTPTPRHSICTGQMIFLTPNQQCQGNEGNPSWTEDNPSVFELSCVASTQGH